MAKETATELADTAQAGTAAPLIAQAGTAAPQKGTAAPQKGAAAPQKGAAAPLIASTTHMTKQDWMVTVSLCSAVLAEATELCIPGVITQYTACQLGLDLTLENLLGVATFVCMFVGLCFSKFLIDRLGPRRTLLTSQYLAILAIVFCTMLPEYMTLLLSRVVIGFTAGLNFLSKPLYVARNMSSIDNRKFGYRLSLMCFMLGQAWVSFLGFLIMDVVGWRVFIACASLPFFIPAAFLLQLLATEEGAPEREPECSTYLQALTWKVAKVALLEFISRFIVVGALLLIPVLLRYTKHVASGSDDRCQVAVKGFDLLVLVAYSLCRILGIFIAMKVLKVFTFRQAQCAQAGIQIALFLSMLLWVNFYVVAVCMALNALLFSVSTTELCDISVNKEYLGVQHYSVSLSLIRVSGLAGGVLGNVQAVLVNSSYAVILPVLLNVIWIAIVTSVKDYR